nr:thioesterase family protein [Paracoccus sp. Z118]
MDGWTDHNGHLNMAYYHVIFDLAADMALAEFGISPERAATDGRSVFTVEAHIHYLRELNAGDRVRVSLQVLASDAKRLHYVQTMQRVVDGECKFVAAITENLVLSVDLRTRRVAPWAPDVAERLAALAVGHSALPVPRQVGRIMGLGRPGQF